MTTRQHVDVTRIRDRVAGAVATHGVEDQIRNSVPVDITGRRTVGEHIAGLGPVDGE